MTNFCENIHPKFVRTYAILLIILVLIYLLFSSFINIGWGSFAFTIEETEAVEKDTTKSDESQDSIDENKIQRINVGIKIVKKTGIKSGVSFAIFSSTSLKFNDFFTQMQKRGSQLLIVVNSEWYQIRLIGSSIKSIKVSNMEKFASYKFWELNDYQKSQILKEFNMKQTTQIRGLLALPLPFNTRLQNKIQQVLIDKQIAVQNVISVHITYRYINGSFGITIDDATLKKTGNQKIDRSCQL